MSVQIFAHSFIEKLKLLGLENFRSFKLDASPLSDICFGICSHCLVVVLFIFLTYFFEEQIDQCLGFNL